MLGTHIGCFVKKMWYSDSPILGMVANFENKNFLHWPGFEPGSPTVYAGALPTELPIVHGTMSCSQKSLMLVWWYHQLLSGFLVNGHICLLMIRVLMRNQGLWSDLMAEENSKNPQLGDCLMKTLWSVIASHGVNKIIQFIREGERRKGWGCYFRGSYIIYSGENLYF